MTDVLAIVSKAIFEADAPNAAPGQVLPIDRYTSKNPGLNAVAGGGRLFLVTVRPPDEKLWVVAVLEGPKHDGKAWVAKPNTTPITDVSGLRSKIRFASDTGITAKAGALGMSLQTPRVLTDADVALLLGGKTKAAVSKASAVSKAPAATGDWKAISAALGNARFEHALSMLLDRWADSRDPALAAVIEKTAARTRPAGALATLEALTEGVKFAEALKRITALEKLPPDPRISARLTRFLLEPPFTAQSSRGFWNSLFEQLGGKQADPRTVTALKPVVGKYDQIFGGTVMGAATQKRITALIAALEKQFPVPPDAGVPASVTGALPDAPKAKPPEKGSAEALLAAIYADPKADGPRLVYADFLQEKGDPRGEFIALQFRPERDEKREQALLKQHHKEWQGPLRDITYNDQDVFQRGFLAECRLRLLGGKLRPALGYPGWATVRKITLAIGGTKEHGVNLLLDPAMEHLEWLVDAPYDVVRALGERAKHHRLQTLHIEWMNAEEEDRFTAEDWNPLLTGQTLKHLKELGLIGTEHIARTTLESFWASPRAATLERLVLSPTYSFDPKIWDDVRAHASKQLEVEWRGDGFSLFLRRSGPGRFITTPMPPRVMPERAWPEALDAIGKKFPAPLKTEGLTDAQLKQLKAAGVSIA